MTKGEVVDSPEHEGAQPYIASDLCGHLVQIVDEYEQLEVVENLVEWSLPENF